MEKIIKKAIEGGYLTKINTYDEGVADYRRYVCDPLFWQALGKACGWKKYIWLSYPDYHYDSLSIKEFTDDDKFSPDTTGRMGECKYAARYITYLHYAHCFYDKNLTEGFEKAVEYLEALISPTS